MCKNLFIKKGVDVETAGVTKNNDPRRIMTGGHFST